VPAVALVRQTYGYRCSAWRFCAAEYSEVWVKAGHPNGTTFDWEISAPWYFVGNLGGTSTTVNASDGFQTIGGTPSAGSGTLKVRARNCNGVSAWTTISFLRETDYWCNHEFALGSCPTGGGWQRVNNNNPINIEEDNTVQSTERLANIPNNTLQSSSSQIQNFTIYPNPTNGIVHLSTEEAIESVQVFDVQGRLISEQHEIAANTQTDLDLSFANNGIYIVKIKTTTQMSTQKLVLAKE
jgi:hypothetical protein